jgi:hypothetical protein
MGHRWLFAHRDMVWLRRHAARGVPADVTLLDAEAEAAVDELLAAARAGGDERGSSSDDAGGDDGGAREGSAGASGGSSVEYEDARRSPSGTSAKGNGARSGSGEAGIGAADALPAAAPRCAPAWPPADVRLP